MQLRKTGWALAAGAGAALAVRAVVRQARHIDLRGKTVLITGGSRGLGLVLAREFARRGARLAVCARDQAELRRAATDLTARGARVLTIPCDVTDPAQIQEMVHVIEVRWGPVDVLVNNAGVIQVGPVEVMTPEDYEEAMRVHFWGPLHLMLAVLPEMRRRRSGRIVNIASIGGKLSPPHLIPYNASKFALVGLSEGLRAELMKDGVYVTTVCPGLMRTGSPRNATFKGQHRAEFAWFSISDSLPGLTMSAERAARRIVRACQAGEAEVILTLPARLAVLFHGMFPGLTADFLSVVNRLLPGPGGIGTSRALGKDSESALAPSWLTALSDEAARRNNEISDGSPNGRRASGAVGPW
jgi:short-subunit dehydrogenase